MYRIAIKPSAIEHNPRVESTVDRGGTHMAFESRQEAEQFTAEMCAGGEPVRLQAPAPQDPDDVQAYLVRDRQHNEWTPIASRKRGMTFRVGGNTFGSIGLGIVYGAGKVSPPLAHYFTEVAPAAKRGRVTAVEIEPYLPQELYEAITWRPDLRLTVSPTRSGSDHVYYAEVKSGGASFQRNQRTDMQRVAEEFGVLRIRLDLDSLPEAYTARIDEVEPDQWPE